MSDDVLAEAIGDFADNYEPWYLNFKELAATAVRNVSFYDTDEARREAYAEAHRVSEIRDWAAEAGLSIRDWLAEEVAHDTGVHRFVWELLRHVSRDGWTALGDRYLPEPADVWAPPEEDDEHE